jgi:predicted DNA-binding protein (UPF0251 family)
MHTDTVAGLLLERAVLEQKVNNYTQSRYNINSEYYDWKCECAELDKYKEHISCTAELQAQSNAEQELFEKKTKLSRDARQDYTKRYIQLDNELFNSQHLIKRINKQLLKLQAEKKERPILRLNKNTAEHIILEDYHNAKQMESSLQQQIEQQTVMLQSIQSEIDCVSRIINSGQRPDEISEFEARAKQRLSIMESRLQQNYECTIAAVEIKVSDTRQLLETYTHKYDIVLANKGKKNINSVTAAISTIEGKLERKLVLDRLINDKAQLLDSIAQLPPSI